MDKKALKLLIQYARKKQLEVLSVYTNTAQLFVVWTFETKTIFSRMSGFPGLHHLYTGAEPVYWIPIEKFSTKRFSVHPDANMEFHVMSWFQLLLFCTYIIRSFTIACPTAPQNPCHFLQSLCSSNDDWHFSRALQEQYGTDFNLHSRRVFTVQNTMLLASGVRWDKHVELYIHWSLLAQLLPPTDSRTASAT